MNIYDEAIQEFACNAGPDRPDQAWLLSDYDVWVSNPYFRGPRPPHPEDDHGNEQWYAMTPEQQAADASRRARALRVHFGYDKAPQAAQAVVAPDDADDPADNDIPF